MADNGATRSLLAATTLACVAAIAWGGASSGAPIRLALVELCSLPALALALLAAARKRRLDWGAGVVGLIAVTPLLQLVPLPPAVWRRLAGGDARLEALTAAGFAPGWEPLSLFPAATVGCALAVVAPVAVFLATAQLRVEGRRMLGAVWLVGAAAGLVFGIVQLSQPNPGWAFLYATTNPDSLVGLFANRNHQAAWLLALLPISAALAAPGLVGSSSRKRVPALALGVLFPLVAVGALAAVRSRAGILLAIPAAAGALAVLAGLRPPRRTLAILAIAPVIAVAAVAAFASGPMLDRFATQSRPEARADVWPVVLDAGRQAMPFGSGAGSFDRAYRSAEPLDLVGPAFLNHAHNDYLEVWVETGLVGIALLAASLAWIVLRAARAWSPAGNPLARASSVSAGLLLAASVVDYPLRTETLACLFAYACGCLASPPPLAGVAT